MWNAEKVLDDAERDLVCESMLGMVQPGNRAGIGFGDWKRPWEKMGPRERNKATIERVLSGGEPSERTRSWLWESGTSEWVG